MRIKKKGEKVHCGVHTVWSGQRKRGRAWRAGVQYGIRRKKEGGNGGGK